MIIVNLRPGEALEIDLAGEAKVLLLVAGAVVGICFLVFWVEPLGVLGVLERLTPGIVYRVQMGEPSIRQGQTQEPGSKNEPGAPNQTQMVGLTFDDGPHPVFTPQVLDILKSHDAKATFFLIGERARRYPELVARIKAEGHEIGNHYIRDGATLFHSDEEFVRNLLETEKAIGLMEGRSVEQKPGRKDGDVKLPVQGLHTGKGIHGGRTKVPPLQNVTHKAPGERDTERGRKLFRAPGGVAWPRQLRLAREYGYTCVLGCAYPHDPMRPPVWYMRWLIEKNLRPGTIVILHDGISDASRSVRALPDVLVAGRKKGLRFVSVGELMGERSAG